MTEYHSSLASTKSFCIVMGLKQEINISMLHETCEMFFFFYIGEWKAKLAVRWSTQCSWNKDMLSYYCLNGIASSFVRTETALDWKTTTILGTEIRQKKKLSKSATFTRKVKMTSMVAKNIELKIRLTIIRSWFTCLSSHCKASSDYLVTQNQFKLTGRGRE